VKFINAIVITLNLLSALAFAQETVVSKCVEGSSIVTVFGTEKDDQLKITKLEIISDGTTFTAGHLTGGSLMATQSGGAQYGVSTPLTDGLAQIPNNFPKFSDTEKNKYFVGKTVRKYRSLGFDGIEFLSTNNGRNFYLYLDAFIPNKTRLPLTFQNCQLSARLKQLVDGAEPTFATAHVSLSQPNQAAH
jgi:hypothetical protein